MNSLIIAFAIACSPSVVNLPVMVTFSSTYTSSSTASHVNVGLRSATEISLVAVVP